VVQNKTENKQQIEKKGEQMCRLPQNIPPKQKFSPYK
jgi:hypothetical protein